MYTLYKFHFLNGISKINQLFDDILMIWPAPVYTVYIYMKNSFAKNDKRHFNKKCSILHI